MSVTDRLIPPKQDMEKKKKKEYCLGNRNQRVHGLLANPKFALFLLCFLPLIQGGIVNGLLHYFLSTLEKRFELDSTESGAMSGAYDVGSLLTTLPVSYLGGRRSSSKPRWLAVGIFLLGLGSLIFSLPAFILSPTNTANSANSSDNTPTPLCHKLPSAAHTSYSHQQSCKEPKLAYQFWVLLLGNLIHGVGASPIFTLAVAYIDENVPRNKSSLYLGVYYSMTLIGPGLGYLAGGGLSTIYADFLFVDPSEWGLVYGSPGWVGCWWLGFLVSSILCFILSLPIYALPKRLAGGNEEEEDVEEEDEDQVMDDGSGRNERRNRRMRMIPVGMDADDRGRPRSGVVVPVGRSNNWELCRKLGQLITNATFLLVVLAGCCEAALFSGMGSFFPKILEFQFGLGSKNVAIFLGSVVLPGALVGTLVGGWVLKLCSLNVGGTLTLCLISMSAALTAVPALFIDCPTIKIVGISAPYHPSSTMQSSDLLRKSNIAAAAKGGGLWSECNCYCDCDESNYSPVCGIDNLFYYSPCFAGCTHSSTKSTRGIKYYWDCSCINKNDEELKTNGTENDWEASSEPCHTEEGCPLFPLFVIMMIVYQFFTFCAMVPAIRVILRCVNSDMKSVAMGVQWMLVRLLGTVPGPVIMGSLIDKACLYWHHTCRTHGTCILYDNDRIGRHIAYMGFTWKGTQICLFSLALWHWKRRRKSRLRL